MQTCSICHIDKEDSDFGTYLYQGQIKRKTHCKQCYRQIRHQSWLKHRRKHLDKAKVYRQTHKEEFRLRQRKWYAKNKPNEIQRLAVYRSTWEGKISQWKLGAKRRKIQWSISESFLKQLPMKCHYSGLPLTMEIGQPNTLSIDRVDSSQPYIETNIVPCCSVVNIMKGELSQQDFIMMCQRINAHTSQLAGS